MQKTYFKVAVLIGIVLTVGGLLYGGKSWLDFVGSQYPPTLSTNSSPNLESYLRLAGIGITLLVSATTALLSLVNILIQVGMAREIERLKPLLTLQFAAYKELNGAAIGIFDCLSRLQNSTYNPSLAQSADDELTKAQGTLFFMPQDYQTNWINF